MKDYNVQQVSDLLKANPETVRRWIRSGKLKAVQDSRKGGNIISEEALKKFMRETPKYAGLVATVFAPVAVALPIAVGSLMGSIMSAIYGQKQKVSSDDIAKYLRTEIDRYEKSVVQKKKTIEQLQAEVISDEKQIESYKYALQNIDLKVVAKEVNTALKNK